MFMSPAQDVLLYVKDLTLSLDGDGEPVRVIENVSFGVDRGEMLAMVGESGSGKSVTSLAILRLLPVPPWNRESGKVFFRGRDLYALDPEEMREIRGRDISIVLQEPMTSLNPFSPIGRQVEEVLIAHLSIDRREAKRRALDALAEVGIPGASERAGQYPHQLSGGLKQRAMIAMALALRPSLLLADEPTTALDLTIQMQILDLIGRLSEVHGMAVIFITHDLALVKGMAERTLVMYAGLIVESSRTENLFGEPFHPYTKALIEVIPQLGERRNRFGTIPGSVPKPGMRPGGCPFHPRCSSCMDRCRTLLPGMKEIASGRMVRCWLY
jgi:oligopeptide/dipeptide ABC transporter ATP-binding protein